ncbi:TolC family protein [Massilia sp. W12]|uniref:TolC family protein n=1 Tax=Massilia sp. W12 TaxID=3126507 RepID=UPI0030CED07B
MKCAKLVLRCGSAAVLFSLAACSQLTPVRPAPALPAQFSVSLAAHQASAPRWSNFGDDGLRAWIAQVWAGNSELRLGLARLDSAAQDLRLVRAQQSASINLEQSAERRKNSALDQGESESKNPSSRYTSQISFGYEIDLRGRLAAARKASEAEQSANQHDLLALRLSLARQTAELWLSRAELQANIDNTRQTIALRQQLLQSEQRKRAAGMSKTEALQEHESALLTASLLLNKQEQGRQSVERNLCLLANLMPGECRLPAGKPLAALALPQLGNGVPAQLLQQRPDLAAAQARYDAARSRIDEAEAARWPSLSIAGVIGVNAAAPAGLLKKGANHWSLMPQFALPLFDGGRRQAELEKSKSAAEQHYLQWHAAITRAVHEVESGSASLLESRQNAHDLQAVHSIAARQLEKERQARKAGLGNAQSEWRSQLALLQVEQEVSAARHAQLLANVHLQAALGGAWPGTPDAP